MKILVTGSAGFIGFHLVQSLLNEGHKVVGLDNLNHYYDVTLKLDRLAELDIDAYQIAMGKTTIDSNNDAFRFYKLDLVEDAKLMEIFEKEKFDIVFNLAAQAGVRYSIEHPQSYVKSNLVGFANLLEACRSYPVKHLIYASSSSVYGSNKEVPFKTEHNVDHPVSFYAATKKSNELMAHAYSHLFKIPTTGLRFFTVYGEWGRPDMATMLFAKAIMNDRPIKVFNNGKMSRDFTYVGDIVEGMIKVMHGGVNASKVAQSKTSAPYKVYNIGNSKPVNLLEFIETMEEVLGKKAKKDFMPMQQGDMENTYADVEDLKKDYGYQPHTPLRAGIQRFADWYKSYYYREDQVGALKEN